MLGKSRLSDKPLVTNIGSFFEYWMRSINFYLLGFAQKENMAPALGASLQSVMPSRPSSNLYIRVFKTGALAYTWMQWVWGVENRFAG